MTGAAHLGFFRGLLEDPKSALAERPTAIPWYYDRFVKAGHRLDAPPHNASISALTRFFHMRHFPWWRDVHTSARGRIRLFNTNSFIFQEGPPVTGAMDLRRLANFLHPDLGNRDADSVHRFFCDTCVQQKARGVENAAADGAPAYVATLAQAATNFMNKEYPILQEAGNAKNLLK